MQIRRGIKQCPECGQAAVGLRVVQIRRGIKQKNVRLSRNTGLRVVQIRRGIKPYESSRWWHYV